MAPFAVLNVSLVEAATLVSAPWLALGGILVALREFWVALRHRVKA